MKRSLGPTLLLLAACGGSAVDHEGLGDEHYGAGRFPEAQSEYRTAQRGAPPAAAIWAKLGAAALHAGDLAAAVEAYEALGLAEPTRQQEAARGLERVIRAARRPDAEGGNAIVSSAVVALRRVAPERPLSRQALGPAGLEQLGRGEAVRVLPAALGSADRSAQVDQLLLEYGRALEATTACDAAAEAYRTVLRRAAVRSLTDQARRGLGACALRLGLDALQGEQHMLAEDWLRSAVSADSTGPAGLRARVGLGDARLAQGDVLGAAIWWQTVLSLPGVPDSLHAMAAAKLNALAAAGPPGGEVQ